jgi:proline iminopeptidase
MIVTINDNDLNVEVLGARRRAGADRSPHLLTVGRTDWVTPVSSAQTIASLIPDSRLVIFEKSGHSPQIEEFEKFQAVIRDSLHEVI